MALRQHVSLLMMPFYLKNGSQEITIEHDSIWNPCQVSFDKSKLYSHVSRFLKSNTSDNGVYHYQFYSLSEKASHLKEMLRKQMCIRVKNGDEYSKNIVFKLGEAEATREERLLNVKNISSSNTITPDIEETQESFFSPKLVICPTAGVGVLILSVHLVELKDNPDNFSIKNLLDLNYALFKTYPLGSSQTHQIYLKSQIDIIRCQEKLYDASSTEDTRLITQLEKQIEGMKKKLPEKVQCIDKSLEREHTINDFTERTWTMNELTHRLMLEFENLYERFDEYRLHVFTYLQLDETDESKSILEDYERIIKLQNANYKAIEGSQGSPIYEQSFKNIYMGCTVEGGSIMTFVESNSQNSTFIKDFMYSSLSQSYLWTYIMIQIQRYTLLYLEGKLTNHNYLQNTQEERDLLRELIRSATQNKVSSFFVDISDHTQHNQFYYLCCRNLKLRELSYSVEQKLEMLTDYLKVLTEEESEKEAVRRDYIGRWIAVIGAVFALFSSTYDAFCLFDKGYLGIFSDETSLIERISIVFSSIFAVAFCFWVLAHIYVGRKR